MVTVNFTSIAKDGNENIGNYMGNIIQILNLLWSLSLRSVIQSGNVSTMPQNENISDLMVEITLWFRVFSDILKK